MFPMEQGLLLYEQKFPCKNIPVHLNIGKGLARDETANVAIEIWELRLNDFFLPPPPLEKFDSLCGRGG